MKRKNTDRMEESGENKKTIFGEEEIQQTFEILKLGTQEQRNLFNSFPFSEEDSHRVHTTVWFKSSVSTVSETQEV